MEIVYSLLQKGFAFIGPFFILLGLLIFIHELGHFLVAKYYGVRVEVFSLGFGKKILHFRRGDTTYCLSLIPLGGYVKMYGDDPSAEVPSEEKKFAFLHKPIGQRIAIVLAGPLMNLFFAGFLFFAIAMLGEEVAPAKLGDVSEDTEAYRVGFRSGDTIRKINETEYMYWEDVRELIENSFDQNLTFTLERELSGANVEVQVTPQLSANENIFSESREVGAIAGLSTASAAPLIGVRDPNSLAAKGGLKSNYLIESVNGEKIQHWRQFSISLMNSWDEGQINIIAKPYQLGKEPGAAISLTIRDLPKMASSIPEDFAKVLGIEHSELYLLAVKEKSPADKAGLKDGDRVLSINGEAVTRWEDVLNTVKSYAPEQDPLEFIVLREGQEHRMEIRPELTELMNDQHQQESRYTIGIVPAIASASIAPVIRRFTNPVYAMKHGLSETWLWTKMVVMSLVRLVQNEVSPKNIAGVITIGRVASHTYELGITPFLKIMAIISINLFLLNLLPVPVLDGGHLMFFIIEALKGAPVSLRKMEIAQQVGMLILMTLMVFALFNDITNLFKSSW